jgi:hypothetical protein
VAELTAADGIVAVIEADGATVFTVLCDRFTLVTKAA